MRIDRSLVFSAAIVLSLITLPASAMGGGGMGGGMGGGGMGGGAMGGGMGGGYGGGMGGQQMSPPGPDRGSPADGRNADQQRAPEPERDRGRDEGQDRGGSGGADSTPQRGDPGSR